VTPLEQLAELLARLVGDKTITEEQAKAIIAYWRDRPADELAALLPLMLAEGVGPRQEDDDLPPWLPVALLAERLLPRANRRRMIDDLQDRHAEQMAWLAVDLEAGRITVAEWQRQARAVNAKLLAFAARLGGGGTVQMQQYVARVEQEQAAYLQRFADQLAARKLAEAMPDDDDTRKALLAALLTMGAGYIARRAASYSGAARGVFFRSLESGATGPMGGSRDGWVVAYCVNHDERLCSACLDAEGYYLPGDGPYPGEVCYGGGACRCERMSVYDPVVYAQLTGGAL